MDRSGTDLTPQPDSFLPTRQSLLSRLKNWDNQDAWRQFFDLYWRLIYDLARQCGLSDSMAQDVVQETIVAAAKQLPEFRYDPRRGSFKAWLRLFTRRRIADALRQQYRHGMSEAAKESTSCLEVPEEEFGHFEDRWDAEWRSHLAKSALDRVKARANPLHFQAFELLTVQGWSPLEVGRSLKMNLAQLYLIRSRLRRMVRQEALRLDKEGF